MYVSRRLRVFEDEMLAPPVLSDQLAVSTAEELLVVADVQKRVELAQQAVDERCKRPQVRAAVRECIAAIQQPRPRLASRIRALHKELAGLEPDALSERARRELLRLVDVGQRLTD
jgi:cell division protein FtsB